MNICDGLAALSNLYPELGPGGCTLLSQRHCWPYVCCAAFSPGMQIALLPHCTCGVAVAPTETREPSFSIVNTGCSLAPWEGLPDYDSQILDSLLGPTRPYLLQHHIRVIVHDGEMLLIVV